VPLDVGHVLKSVLNDFLLLMVSSIPLNKVLQI
jgi:hypothetical protein